MQIKDRHDFIAAYGTAVVSIMGNVGTKDYELVTLASVPLSPETEANFKARGLGYVGVMAYVLGEFRSAWAVPLDAATVSALAAAFLEFHVAQAANAPEDHSASTEWLRRLHNLPDTRNEEN
jgi:hypothetical protein